MEYILEEQNAWVDTENASDKKSWKCSNDQIYTAEEHKSDNCKKVDPSPHEFEIDGALSPKCQHVSSDSTHAECNGFSIINNKQDDVKEATENNYAHFQEDNVPTVHSEVGTKHPVMIVKRVVCAVQEQKPELGDIADEEKRKCFEKEKEKGKDACEHLLSSPSDVPLYVNKQTADHLLGITLTRATFSPSSPTDKQVTLPALLGGLRVLRKGVTGPEHGTLAQIKHNSQGTKIPVFNEKHSDTKAEGGFLEQISQFLNREKTPGVKEDEDWETKQHQDEIRTSLDGNEECPESKKKEIQAEDDTKVLELVGSTRPQSSAEAAFDAFKAFFTPKPLKKGSTERIDLEAVRKKLRNDRDVLRTIFERTSKTSEQNDTCNERVRKHQIQH